MSELLNSGFTKEHLEKIRKETVKKWESIGFLEGLKGEVKPNIAQLYECCASSLLTGDTKN